MDDLSCHKTAEMLRLVAEVRCLPAYSAYLNRIEWLFSKLKCGCARRRRDGRPPAKAMGEVLRAVRPGDIPGWFRHSGYRPPASTVTVKAKPLLIRRGCACVRRGSPV